MAPSTPYGLRARQQRAANTPGRDRRRSGRMQRETTFDILKNLGKGTAFLMNYKRSVLLTSADVGLIQHLPPFQNQFSRRLKKNQNLLRNLKMNSTSWTMSPKLNARDCLCPSRKSRKKAMRQARKCVPLGCLLPLKMTISPTSPSSTREISLFEIATDCR